MICERPVYNHDTDPENACFACDGRGFQRWFNPDEGWTCDPCRVCSGAATAGVFVVQVRTARFRYELQFHTRSYPAAQRRAAFRALATIRKGGACLGHKALSVAVVFKGTGAGGAPLPDEVTYTIDLTARKPVAA